MKYGLIAFTVIGMAVSPSHTIGCIVGVIGFNVFCLLCAIEIAVDEIKQAFNRKKDHP